MLDFLEIILILTAVVIFGFCIYQQGKRDAHSQARLDVLESMMITLEDTTDRNWLHRIKAEVHSDKRLDLLQSIMCDQDKLNGQQIIWNETMRATVNAMAVQECQRRMFTPSDVRLLYSLMRDIDAHEHEPERIAREGN